jgi:hypothetical protein
MFFDLTESMWSITFSLSEFSFIIPNKSRAPSSLASFSISPFQKAEAACFSVYSEKCAILIFLAI